MKNKNLEKLFHDLFHNAAKLMQRRHRSFHRGHMPVHRAQGLVLYMLDEKGDTSQRDLMEDLDIRSSSLSELLAKLEQQGYITRTRDENDKRGFIISITEAGKAVVGDFKKMRKEHEDALFGSLSEEERAQLITIITKLIKAWKEETGGEDDFNDHMHGHIHAHMMRHRHYNDEDDDDNDDPRNSHWHGRRRF